MISSIFPVGPVPMLPDCKSPGPNSRICPQNLLLVDYSQYESRAWIETISRASVNFLVSCRQDSSLDLWRNKEQHHHTDAHSTSFSSTLILPRRRIFQFWSCRSQRSVHLAFRSVRNSHVLPPRPIRVGSVAVLIGTYVLDNLFFFFTPAMALRFSRQEMRRLKGLHCDKVVVGAEAVATHLHRPPAVATRLRQTPDLRTLAVSLREPACMNTL
ncbi:hypothetical protein FA95DRAFT_87344 [Auriscalpium vulgare]|uniref:Uncharacterized protein n=1 Tax=Auriscalpium vulgare TaxID=40419 RepID=A0ACB8RQN7_9AGAM|nr:hypothetical protein FA95DRAFT_87344 [Auriscalpium vulgare]